MSNDINLWPLKLKWDCSGHKYLEEAHKLCRRWQSGRIDLLMPVESKAAKEVISISESEVARKIRHYFQSDVTTFHKVRDQLLSLLIVWERVLQEKTRFDVGETLSLADMEMQPRMLLMACEIIPRRSSIASELKKEDSISDNFENPLQQQQKTVHKTSKGMITDDDDTDDDDTDDSKTLFQELQKGKITDDDDTDDDDTDDSETLFQELQKGKITDDNDADDDDTDDSEKPPQKRQRTAQKMFKRKERKVTDAEYTDESDSPPQKRQRTAQKVFKRKERKVTDADNTDESEKPPQKRQRTVQKMFKRKEREVADDDNTDESEKPPQKRQRTVQKMFKRKERKVTDVEYTDESDSPPQKRQRTAQKMFKRKEREVADDDDTDESLSRRFVHHSITSWGSSKRKALGLEKSREDSGLSSGGERTPTKLGQRSSKRKISTADNGEAIVPDAERARLMSTQPASANDKKIRRRVGFSHN